MSNRINKRSLILIPFILAASLIIIPSIPRAHAATGLVCIATSGTATSCPASPPTIANLAAGSTLTIGVFIQGSDPMGGFDIYVKTDNTVLNPTAAVFGPLIAHPSSSIRCINNVGVEGACTLGTANAPGVVEMETIESTGVNECFGQASCSGLAFNITYTVQASSGTTPIAYPKAAGCTSSTADPTDCVLVFDSIGNILVETIQAGTYGAAAAATSLVSVVSGTDGNLYWSPFSGTWGTWQPLNGQSPSAPSLCASGTSTSELVIQGSDSGIYHKTFTSGSPGSFQPAWDRNPSGVTIGQPVCAVIGTTLYVVVRGASGELFATTFDLTAHTWGAWVDLQGSSPSTPALAATPAVSRLDLVVRGTNNQIYHKAFTSGGWAAAWDTSNRSPVPDKTIASPAIVSDGSQLNVVVIGTEGNLYYATLSFAGTWSTYTSLTGATPVTPTLVIDSANTLHLVVQGHDNAVYEKAHPSGGSWSATWTSGGGITKGSPAVAVLGTTLNVVTTGADARLWYNTFSGTTFSGWVFMNGAASTSPGVSTP